MTNERRGGYKNPIYAKSAENTRELRRIMEQHGLTPANLAGRLIRPGSDRPIGVDAIRKWLYGAGPRRGTPRWAVEALQELVKRDRPEPRNR